MKKKLCVMMVVFMSLSVATPALAETRAESIERSRNSGNGWYTGELTGYTTRIEGTLTQRGNEFYYVLPDGTDLKNGFVDGDYFSWTGTKVKKYPKVSNQAIYNTAYGGADYSRYPYEASNSWVALNFKDYKVGGIDADIVQSSFAWMDTVAQHAVTLDERSRALYIAGAVADKLTYGVGRPATNPSAQSSPDNYIYAVYDGEGRCQAYAELYSMLCRKSGLAVTNVTGTSSSGTSHAWNLVRVDGSWYFMDTQGYDLDRGSRWLMQTGLFSGYETSDTALAQSTEGF